MANKVLLKKSSVAARVPTTSDLDYGELALNYADGKLYFKNAANAIKSFTIDDSVVTLTGTQTLTNKTLTSPTINGGALSGTFTGAITLSDTTASTSTTTGALKVGGGLGVAGTIYADIVRSVNNGAGTNYAVGDDAWIGDINQSNTIGIRGQQDSTKGYIVFGGSNSTNYIGRDGTNPLTVTGQFAVNSGTVTGANAVALQISGYANKGGTGYHDFLSVTNSYATATNPNKFFRLNSTGNLEIINSAYTSSIFSVTDAGAVSFGGTTFPTSTGTNGQVLTANGSGGSSWTTVSGVGGGGTTTNPLTIGTGLSGTSFNGSTAVTIAIDSTVATLTGTQTLTNKTFTGNVNTNSNLKINCLDGYFTVQQNNASWTTSTDHPIIKWNYNATYDDHLYLASGGNQAVSGQSVLVISENSGLLFGRGDNASVTTLGTKYFQITNTGNVGIGTVSAPSSILETEQNTTSTTSLTITNSNTGNNITKSSSINFRLTDSLGTRKDAAYITAIPINFDSSTGDHLTFSTRTLDSTPTEKVRITNNGDVGIGTTNPGYKLEVNGAFAATTKSFVIPHPTKEGMKLRYGSLEGPENGIYIRGRCKESIIELPEYWAKLVDAESISVNLTPVGSHQNLFVEKIEDNKIYIKNSNVLNRTIDCFFVVYAERSDVEKLKVEYAA